MKTCFSGFLRLLLCSTLLSLACGAHAALSCSITGTTLNREYLAAANTDAAGTLTVTCTRLATDPKKPALWIGIDQTATGRALLRDVGGSTLTHFVYRNNFGGAIWTSTGGRTSTQNQDAAWQDDINFGNALVATLSIPFYWRIPSGQNRAVGVYSDTLTVTLLEGTNSGGAPLATTFVTLLASIRDVCRLASPSVTLPIAYTAFAPAVTSPATFNVTCTLGTTYTLALDASRGLFPQVMLAYSAVLTTPTSETGIATAQGHTVSVTIDGGQAGNCNGLLCNDSDTRRVTITY
jgi:spore coat protein U-like protein